MKFSNATNNPTVEEFGSIVWYLDKNTRNVIYAVDGEDNKDYYSFEAVKKGILASPEHICHYDIWFTNQYPYLQVKGFTKLNDQDDDEDKFSFKTKAEEVEQKLLKWRDTVLAGKISPDGSQFHSFAASNFKPSTQLHNIFNFFACKHMVNDDTEFYFNNNYEGKILELYPELRTAALHVEATEDAATLELINKYKGGDPTAGDQLLEKYEKLIKGIWIRFLKMRGLHPDSQEAEDALSDANYEFVHNITNFDPSRDLKLTTYIYNSVNGILMNFFNTNRNKGENSEINIPHHKGDDSEAGMSFDRMPEKEQGVSPELSEAVNKIMDALPPKEQQVIKSYFYENKTLQQIGDEMGVSKERVRQVVEKALERMRFSPELKSFGYRAEKVKVAMLLGEDD